MKLTEAVTRGRTMLEPRQGNDLYAPKPGCEKYGGCYRGMALVGAGAVKLPIMDDESGDIGHDLTDVLSHTWPWAQKAITGLPCTCKDVKGWYDGFTALQAIGHLWDVHVDHGDFGEAHGEALDDQWTFERITDWLRTIEPAEIAPQD